MSSIVFHRRVRGRQEQLVVEAKAKYAYATHTVGGVEATQKIELADLPKFAASLNTEGWALQGGQRLNITTRFALGEAVAKGADYEALSAAITTSQAPLSQQIAGLIYAQKTLQSFQAEGETNKRWPQAALERVNKPLVQKFLDKLGLGGTQEATTA